MNENFVEALTQEPSRNTSLDVELSELIKQASEQMPNLVEKIQEYQEYCANVETFVAKVSVSSEVDNG